jgi:hypothetical protein
MLRIASALTWRPRQQRNIRVDIMPDKPPEFGPWRMRNE